MFKVDKLVLAETPYASIQGEGETVGMPMTFIRTQGCDVGCSFCDSQATWFPFKPINISDKIEHTEKVWDYDSLLEHLLKLDTLHWWFTGGEPMIQRDGLANFLRYLNDKSELHKHVTHICTAGTIYDEAVYSRVDHVTIDVKAPTSKTKSDTEVIDKILNAVASVELKMVVANNKDDIAFAKRIIKRYDTVDWTLQPTYYNESELRDRPTREIDHTLWSLPDFAKWITTEFRQNDNVRMGLQLHKHIYPDKLTGI